MLVDIARSALVFLHLLFFSGAIVLVIWTDYSVLKSGVDTFTFHVIRRSVVFLLLLLWVSGLLIVLIDTQFDSTLILENQKLVLKLSCVLVLTLNGVLIHHFASKIYERKEFLTNPEAIVLSITGSISTSHWLLAGYIGSANMLNDQPLHDLLFAYACVVLLSGLCGLALHRFVQFRLNRNRARAVLAELGIEPGAS